MNKEIESIKKKFNEVQEKNQQLKENKIRLESQIKTLQDGYDTKLEEFLGRTHTKSYEEAVKYCETQRGKLDVEMQELSKKLDVYLNTYNGDTDE